GPDDRDRSSLPPSGVGYERAAEHLDVGGMRVLWSRDLGFARVDPEVEEIARGAAAELMAAAGLTEVEGAVQLTDPVRVWLSGGDLDVWMELEPGMYPERADELDWLARRSLESSAERRPPQMARAALRRARLQHEVAELFSRTDVLLTP